jgi:mono/diheme cytochrome c family protein
LALALAATGCTVTQAAPETGETVFRAACARCHGASGRGGPPARLGEAAPRNLTDGDWQDSVTDEVLHAVVREGKGPMPAFGKALDDHQIDLVVGHVRALREGASVATPNSEGQNP